MFDQSVAEYRADYLCDATQDMFTNYDNQYRQYQIPIVMMTTEGEDRRTRTGQLLPAPENTKLKLGNILKSDPPPANTITGQQLIVIV